MFGMGLWELVIVAILGCAFLVAPIVVILLVVRASQPKHNDRLAQLEEENLRLRKLLAENGIPPEGKFTTK